MPLPGQEAPRVRRSWLPGAVPHRLDGALHRSPLIEATESVALFRLPTVGRFFVEAHQPVVVEQAEGADGADVDCMFAGPIAALRCSLEGQFCLRGAAVEVEGRAVVAVGGVGGTSSLAATMALRGARVIADGVVCVGGDPLAVWAPAGATPGRVTLWAATWRALSLDPAQGSLIRRVLPSRSFSLGARAPGRPVPLGAVVLPFRDRSLGGGSPAAVGEAVRVPDAVTALRDAEWHAPVVADLGKGRAELEWLIEVATAVKPKRLRRAEGAIAVTLAEMARLAEGMLT